MYQIQCKRLVDQLAFGLSLSQAEAIVARAMDARVTAAPLTPSVQKSLGSRRFALPRRFFSLNDLNKWSSSCAWS